MSCSECQDLKDQLSGVNFWLDFYIKENERLKDIADRAINLNKEMLVEVKNLEGMVRKGCI